MGLFDIIDDIAEKQVLKTETGDNRIFGVMTGIVAKNYDKDMPGRICVTIPVRDKEANELKWARLVMPSSGDKWGHYFLPEVGDQVLLVFDQGNIEKPFVIGCIPKDNNSFLMRAVDERNRYKKIVTRNGNTILFDDNPEGEGEKDRIEITTAKEKHTISLDNERNQIIISDKNGENKIAMQTENGDISIKAAKKMTINVGDNISLTLNGNNGGVTLECTKFNVKSSGGVNMQSDAQTKITGANVTVEASSILNLNSNGTAMVKGTPIKLG